MKSECTKVIPFDSPRFWHLYDQICTDEVLGALVNGDKHPAIDGMCDITRAAHIAGKLHNLKNLGRGWEKNHAWLALKDGTITDSREKRLTYIRVGDVLVVEHGQNRVSTTTHVPIHRYISSSLLSGGQPNTIGLFLPLFDGKTIRNCIEFRLEKNIQEAVAETEKGADRWKWY